MEHFFPDGVTEATLTPLSHPSIIRGEEQLANGTSEPEALTA